MKSAFALAALGAVALLSPTLAFAGEKIDMAEITCQQFLADQEGIMPTVIWIDGYLGHQTGNTVIDMDELIGNVKTIAETCASEPDKKIMELVPADE